MHELDELARLNKDGLRTEYDLMDASWFAPESGYRSLRAADWPSGPDAWLAKCRATGIRPGMRIDGNATPQRAQIPAAWKNSLGQDGQSLSLFEGGYLPDLIAALQSWYDRGVRLFDFGSVDLSAATPASAAKMSSSQIAAGNVAALREALQLFRDKNRDAVIVVSLGPEVHGNLLISPKAGAISAETSATSHADWDALSPFAQIESAGFTATGVADSGMHAWKGAFLLSLAHEGRLHSIHGDLSLVEKDDARWMAHAQRLFLSLQEEGSTRSFGAPAGSGECYGFAASNPHGSVYIIVNPGEIAATLSLPAIGPRAEDSSDGRVQFSDAGFTPILNDNAITLGPGQMAMVGYGAYASSSFNFGVEQDVVIPRSVEPVDAQFYSTDSATLVASFQPPIDGIVRVVLRPRTSGAQSPDGPVAPALAYSDKQAFTLDASQYGRPIPVRLENDGGKHGPTGWMVGEIDVNDLTPGVPLVVQFHANDTDMASVQANAYAVEY